MSQIVQDKVLFKRFQIIKNLDVNCYSAIDNITKTPVFIKICENGQEGKQLQKKFLLGCDIARRVGISGHEKTVFHGVDGNHHLLASELLSTNFEQLFQLCGMKFHLSVILSIALQLVRRLEILHECGFLHCEVQPKNIFIGLNSKKEIIYLTGTRYLTRYINSKQEHINHVITKYQGNPRYSSLSLMTENFIGRKDDLEMLGYVLIYFLNSGSLPWMKLHVKSKGEKKEKILKCKLQTKIENLCEGQPKQFIQYFQYIHSLKYYQKPDYKYIIDLFESLGYSNSIFLNHKYSLMSNLNEYSKLENWDSSQRLCPWTPKTNGLWPEQFRKSVIIVLLVENKLKKCTHLPVLPHEIWINILTNLSNEWPHN